MDFKKLAVFIRILGVLVLGYGAIQWAANQPETFKPREVKQGMFGLPDFAAQLDNDVAAGNVRAMNFQKENARSNAVKVMIAGGVLLFAGFAVSSSAKSSPNT